MHNTSYNWKNAILPISSSIHEAISCLDETSLKIVLVVNENQKFLGTITDGDIRRGILRGIGLHEPIFNILQNDCITCTNSLEINEVLNLMRKHAVNQIPVVNLENHLVGLHLRDLLEVRAERINPMVVMAGGMGSRLSTLTELCPKPMLKVMGKPILEHIVEKGKSEGFNHYIFTIRHLGNVIKDYFKDGADFGIEIEYVSEEVPLGTVGSLALLKDRLTMPFLLTNGDVLTNLDYGALLDFHINTPSSMTMVIGSHEIQNPFGVVELDKEKVVDYVEKPIITSFINSGIYAMDPTAIEPLTLGQACDMPELFRLLRSSNKSVFAYPLHEKWIDIGRPSDFERANLGIFDD
jgi:dTDP-glucose pyrophosphorylase